MAIVFAMLATGILRLHEWRARTNPDGKLRFARVEVGLVVDQPGAIPEGVALGFRVRNHADFPIEFHVKAIKSTFGNKLNPASTYSIRNIKIEPQGEGWYRDDPISVKPDDMTNASTGTLYFKLEYGRPGKLKYVMEQKSGDPSWILGGESSPHRSHQLYPVGHINPRDAERKRSSINS